MLVLHIKVAYILWNMIFEVAVGYGCWRKIMASTLCFGDSVLNLRIDSLWFSSAMMGFQWLVVLQWFLILSFSVVDGWSVKIWWNEAFRLWCCILGVSNVKIYGTWKEGFFLVLKPWRICHGYVLFGKNLSEGLCQILSWNFLFFLFKIIILVPVISIEAQTSSMPWLN